MAAARGPLQAGQAVMVVQAAAALIHLAERAVRLLRQDKVSMGVMVLPQVAAAAARQRQAKTQAVLRQAQAEMG